MLISDLPFARGGIKTKESARKIFERYTYLHIDTGIAIMEQLRQARVNAFNHRK
jgi:AMP nucleosidase